MRINLVPTGEKRVPSGGGVRADFQRHSTLLSGRSWVCVPCSRQATGWVLLTARPCAPGSTANSLGVRCARIQGLLLCVQQPILALQAALADSERLITLRWLTGPVRNVSLLGFGWRGGVTLHCSRHEGPFCRRGCLMCIASLLYVLCSPCTLSACLCQHVPRMPLVVRLGRCQSLQALRLGVQEGCM